MRKSTLPVAVVLALLAVAWSQAPGADGKDAPRILVVDLQKIIDESEEGREFVGKLRQQVAEKKKDIAERVRQLQEKQKRLMEKALPERDKQWYEDVKAALGEMNRLKTEEQFFVAEVNDKIARAINQLLRGAMQESRKLMKEKGADLVLNSRMGKLQINNDQQLQEEVVLRRVVCADSALDVTAEVLKRMNDWWRQNRQPRAGG